MSSDEFAEDHNESVPPSEVEGLDVLEIDISKYDKSQGRVLLKFECEIYKLLGLSDFDIQLWINYHEKTVISDGPDGVKATSWYQRKSGDAATFFGDTVVFMGIIAALYDLDNIKLGIFAGDDSLHFGVGLTLSRAMV